MADHNSSDDDDEHGPLLKWLGMKWQRVMRSSPVQQIHGHMVIACHHLHAGMMIFMGMSSRCIMTITTARWLAVIVCAAQP